MKLSAHDCDMLRSFVHTGDVAGLISFVEGLDGKALDSGSDPETGSTAQATGSSSGAKDTGKKAGSRG